MRAVFQGEFHISSTDRELLDSHLDADADALFVEQREDRVSPESWSIGYLSFLIGALTLYWLQSILYDGPDIKEKAKVPVHDKIDTNLPYLYSRFPEAWKTGFSIFSGLMFLMGVFVSRYPLPLIDAPLASLIYTVLAKPLFVIASPLLYSFFLIFFEEKRLGTRDQDMADEIHRISKENGYDTVVVSCGDAHLDRLPDLLEEKGWETNINKSDHSWAAKIWRW